MSQNPGNAADADVDDVLEVEPPVTLSEALGEATAPDLSSISGVGEVFAARLQNHGVCEPEDVATMDVAELASALRTSPGRAQRIRAAARRQARG